MALIGEFTTVEFEDVQLDKIIVKMRQTGDLHLDADGATLLVTRTRDGVASKIRYKIERFTIKALLKSAETA